MSRLNNHPSYNIKPNLLSGIDNEKLRLTLRHPSYFEGAKNKQDEALKNKLNYERLEFLGDSILQVIVSTYLYENFPERNSGELSTMRSFIVAGDFLAKQAKKLCLEDKITLSRLDHKKRLQLHKKVLADAFEVLLGFLYLEHGLAWSERWLLELIKDEVEMGYPIFLKKNDKTRLQELLQKQSCKAHYEVESTKGLPHERSYMVALYREYLISGKEVEQKTKRAFLKRAEGSSIREAETKCASLFLKGID